MKKKTALVIILSCVTFILLIVGGVLLFQEELETKLLDPSLTSEYAVIYKYETEGSNTKLYLNNYDSGTANYEVLSYPTILLKSFIVLDSDLPAEVEIEIRNFRYHINKAETIDVDSFTKLMLDKISEIQRNTETIFSSEILYYKFALTEIYMKSTDQETKDTAKEMFEYYGLVDLSGVVQNPLDYSRNMPFACLIQEEIEESEITEDKQYLEICKKYESTDSLNPPENYREYLEEIKDLDDLYLKSGITEMEDDVTALSSTILLDNVIIESSELEDIYTTEVINTKINSLTKDNLCYWIMVSKETQFTNQLEQEVLNTTEDMNKLNNIFCTGIHTPKHVEYLSDLRFKDIAFALYYL